MTAFPYVVFVALITACSADHDFLQDPAVTNLFHQAGEQIPGGAHHFRDMAFKTALHALKPSAPPDFIPSAPPAEPGDFGVPATTEQALAGAAKVAGLSGTVWKGVKWAGRAGWGATKLVYGTGSQAGVGVASAAVGGTVAAGSTAAKVVGGLSGVGAVVGAVAGIYETGKVVSNVMGTKKKVAAFEKLGAKIDVTHFSEGLKDKAGRGSEETGPAEQGFVQAMADKLNLLTEAFVGLSEKIAGQLKAEERTQLERELNTQKLAEELNRLGELMEAAGSGHGGDAALTSLASQINALTDDIAILHKQVEGLSESPISEVEKYQPNVLATRLTTRPTVPASCMPSSKFVQGSVCSA